MAGKQHGMLPAQLADKVADCDDLPRVQADGGFVQHDEFRIPQHRLGEAYALLVALGQLAARPVLHVGKLGAREDRLHIRALPGKPLELRGEAQVLAHAHIRVQRRLFGQVSDQPFGLQVIFINVVPADFYFARVGRQAARLVCSGSSIYPRRSDRENRIRPCPRLKSSGPGRRRPVVALAEIFYLYQFAVPSSKNVMPLV